MWNKMEGNKIFNNKEKLEKWFDWLTNKDIKLNKISGCKSPNLSRNKAFNILYTLQEYLGVISDEFEICKSCGYLGSMNDGSVDNIDREDYQEQGFVKKPTKQEEGIYCEDCLRRKFGFT